MPYAWTVAPVDRGGRERGLLGVREVRTLKALRSGHYALPGSTRELATRASPARAKELLERCRAQRADVWRLLEKGSSGR